MPYPVILVVDDHDASRYAKIRLFQKAGFKVLESATGADALTIAVERVPDAIVLDVNLPDINGMEVSRRLRTTSGEPSAVPILQVSSTSVSAAEQVRGLEHGADIYLTEPVDGDVLVATVRALVRARRAERALAVALQRERTARLAAEEANATKNDFIATLSHELRTPLNALLGSVWQLKHVKSDDTAQQRALDRIERSASAQARLINDLLDLSRIAKGKLTLALHLVDLAALLAESVEAVRPAAQAKPVGLELATVPTWVIADPDRLQQVFVNLISNAIQFTPAGGRIRVALEAQGAEAVCRVEDSGAGIEPDFLPLVFEQFRQGEGGMSRKHGGLGLGLAVVKQLVDLHDGRVAASSGGVGHGATFEVRLPREVPHAAPERAAPALEGLRVCLLERNRGSDLATTLAAAGCRLIDAEVSQSVSALLSAGACDVVVMTDEVASEIGVGPGLVPGLLRVADGESPAAVVRRLSRAAWRAF
ncbi:MAG: response regulator [Acidobacteria bacterium]|nr:response regulator [Acidobacteriota bacterium]